MIKAFIWLIVGGLYKGLAKPLLFLSSPDKAHAGTIRLFSLAGKSRLFLGLVRLVFKRRTDQVLSQVVAGIEFKSPVGLSAGFDKNAEVVPIISSLGFGFGEVGSVTAEACQGNPRPWFYRLPKAKSLVVYVGLANHGSKAVLKRLKSTADLIHKNYVTILSVAKTNIAEVVTEAEGIEDYIATLRRAAKSREVRAVEVNISCPNTYGGEPFTAPDKLERLLRAVDKVGLKQPVFIKMPVDLAWEKNKALLDVIVKHNVAGVTIANLVKDRSLVNLGDELPESVRGNLSGRPTFDISNDLIRQTYQTYGARLAIIGVGGVFSAEDAYTKIKLGASLVELITSLIFEGPQIASQINDGLKRLMLADGFSHISQAVGKDVLKPVDK